MRKVYTVFNGVTATTTADPIDIKGAKKVTLLCKRANHGSGSSAFSATVGANGEFATYNRWISNVTNTNAQGITRVASLSLSSNTTDFLTMSPEDAFEFIKVTVTETTDGTHSAWLIVDYDDDKV